MTLFKMKLEGGGCFCVDLDTISSFYIGSTGKLNLLSIGGSAYVTPVSICNGDANRLLDLWENREKEHI